MIADRSRMELLYKYVETAYRYTERHCHDDVEPAQAKQRDITRWSFEIIRGVRPDVQPFTKLLIQFPDRDGVPDWIAPESTVFLHSTPLKIGNSFDVPFQPVGPFFVLEYLTEANQRSIQENYEWCERELKIPYYLRFDFETNAITLLNLKDGRYSALPPDANGRFALPELGLEVAILETWVRYWFRGELIPLPGELLNELAKLREELKVKGQQT
jgi:Putative restriction endonuclease